MSIVDNVWKFISENENLGVNVLKFNPENVLSVIYKLGHF